MPPCRFTGCPYPVPYRGRHFCKGHWAQYGGKTKADREPWVTFLINQHQQMVDTRRRDAERYVSLDRMLDSGAYQLDEVEMFTFRGGYCRPKKEKDEVLHITRR